MASLNSRGGFQRPPPDIRGENSEDLTDSVPERPPGRFPAPDRSPDDGIHKGWPQLPATQPLKTLGNALRHQRRAAAAALLACLVIAGGLVVLKPKTYDGTSLLFVDERHNSSQGFDLALQAGELMSHHYLEMATSRVVLQAACQGPDATSIPAGTPCSPTDLAGQVRADTVTGTSEISITVAARSPDAAAALANAIANALVAQDKQQVAQLLAPSKESLDKEQQRLEAAIKVEESHLPPNSSSPNLASLEIQLNDVHSRQLDLQAEQYRLDGNLSVIQPALPPTKPADPDKIRYGVVGLVAGLALALILALTLEYFDDRVREPGDLARAAGTALVLAVPKNGHATDRDLKRHYALAHSSLLAAQPRLRRVLVAASSPRDEADVAAHGLAGAAAEGGQPAVVMGKLDLATRPVGPEELTVIAAPAPEISSRVINVCRYADATILVATAGATRISEAQRTAELLRQAGAEVALGILLSR
jgi:capsular polysaccharide biosynthesis protein